MKVLVYIGYQKKPLEYQDFIDGNDIGGTEITALKLAEGLHKYGFEVYFGGNLTPGFHNGVEWLDIVSCESKHFDLAIGASYLHFVHTIDAKNYIMWWHNTDYYPWLNGEAQMNDNHLNDGFVRYHVALTEWHKNYINEAYDIIPETIVIGNSIDRKTFPKADKIRDSFIYSSAPERGLYKLLEMWPTIKSNFPNATLNVFAPGYSKPDLEEWPEGVTYHGTVSQEELHRWQAKSEYWLHPTDYEETYCITALEAQYAGCIPITNPVAALTEIVGNRGYLVDADETVDAYIDIIKELKRSPELRLRKAQKCHEWAKQQNWNVRILEWVKLLREYEN